jgi:hypothetical protein
MSDFPVMTLKPDGTGLEMGGFTCATTLGQGKDTSPRRLLAE